jgi:spermidine synthase
VGGGDGGIARELLRHAAIEAVTLVDIDRGVIDLTRAHMPALWGGAADDPRLSIVIDDGAAFVRRADAGPYDLIIVDSTDPVGPAETLFTDHFYAHARARLSPGGVLVTQNGVAFLQGAQLASTLRAFGALFHDAACYLATIPTYTGGPMAFGWGADGDARFTPHETIAERVARAGLRLRYYSPEVHAAAFVLPPYVAERLERSAHVLQRRTGPHGSHPS